jgi:hypothetical protein
MNTVCNTCTTHPFASLSITSVIGTWKAAARAWWTGHTRSRKNESELRALDGLSADTLKDIGAPEWLQDQAYRARERAHQGGLFERDSLHWR